MDFGEERLRGALFPPVTSDSEELFAESAYKHYSTLEGHENACNHYGDNTYGMSWPHPYLPHQLPSPSSFEPDLLEEAPPSPATGPIWYGQGHHSLQRPDPHDTVLMKINTPRPGGGTMVQHGLITPVSDVPPTMAEEEVLNPIYLQQQVVQVEAEQPVHEGDDDHIFEQDHTIEPAQDLEPAIPEDEQKQGTEHVERVEQEEEETEEEEEGGQDEEDDTQGEEGEGEEGAEQSRKEQHFDKKLEGSLEQSEETASQHRSQPARLSRTLSQHVDTINGLPEFTIQRAETVLKLRAEPGLSSAKDVANETREYAKRAGCPSRRRRTSSTVTTMTTTTMASADPCPYPTGSAERAKRSRFLERNRLAASKCRQKKKEWSSGLEARAKQLQANREALGMLASSLKEEVLFLKNEMLRHGNCDCPHIKSYLQKEIGILAKADRKCHCGHAGHRHQEHERSRGRLLFHHRHHELQKLELQGPGQLALDLYDSDYRPEHKTGWSNQSRDSSPEKTSASVSNASCTNAKTSYTDFGPDIATMKQGLASVEAW